MKSNSTWTLAVLASFVCAIGLAGCGSGGSTGCTVNCGGGGGGTSITVTGATLLEIGAPTYQYTCSSAPCTWTSSDTSVLKINSTTGVATPDAKNTGTATITATANGATGTLDVTVGSGMIYATTQPATDTMDLLTGKTTEVEPECYDPAYFADHQLALCVPNIATISNQFYVFAPSGDLNGVAFSQVTLTFTNLIGVDLATPSPDGTTVAFIANDPTVKLWGVYVAPFTNATASPTPTLIYQSPAGGIGLGRPQWSPNGKSLVINKVSTVRSDIWIVPATANSTGVPVTSAASNADNAADGSFSKDGKTIYYDSCQQGGSCQILSTPADNNGTNAGSFIVGGAYPEISPNGSALLFDDENGIEMIDLTTGTVKLLVGGGSLASW